MKELKEAVQKMMKEEYERAAKIHGKTFNSPHEAYAVIKEEVEEAELEEKYLKKVLEIYWENVKNDDTKCIINLLHEIEEYAIDAACECIQVAAMAYKARR